MSDRQQKKNSLRKMSKAANATSERLLKKTGAKMGKAARKASGVCRLTGFDLLTQTNRLAIELDRDEDPAAAIAQFLRSRHQILGPLKFWVLDTTRPRAPTILYPCALTQQGFTVEALRAGSHHLMHVALPNEPVGTLHEVTIGKLLHPSRLKLFTFNQVCRTPVARQINVVKMAESETGPFLTVEMRSSFTCWLAKCLGFTFDATIYEVKRHEAMLASISPRVGCSTRRTYDVEFLDACPKEPEVRAVVLAMALLLTMRVAYAELGEMLEEWREERSDK